MPVRCVLVLLAAAGVLRGQTTVPPDWALRPLPAHVSVPPVSDAWITNEIDAFVLARARAAGLEPSPVADRRTLLRRLSYDLTGLPPTTAELAAFDAHDADDADRAFDAAVERLLASPRYGERMATPWLDAARYADTLGYQADREQRVWPWRDWVVAAFNQNLPYDDFLTWQLAGDLLPDATRAQRLATTFQRLHRQTEEGGTVEEEFRVEYGADRVDTFGTAMLGLTVGCARCHDHKHDPISARDYYGLWAMFANIDESGQTSHFTDAVPVPALALPTADDTRAMAGLARRVADAEMGLRLARAAVPATGALAPPLVDAVAHYPLESVGGEGALANRVAGGRGGVAVDGPEPIDGVRGRGLRLDGENGLEFEGVGSAHSAQPFSVAISLLLPHVYDRAVVIHKSRAALDAGSRGWQLLIEDGALVAVLAHMWPHDAAAVRARRPLPLGRWVSVAMTHDGSRRAGGVRLFVDGLPVATDVIRDGLRGDLVYERGGEPPMVVGQRFRDRGLAGGGVDEIWWFARQLSALEVLELARPGAFAAAVAGAPDLRHSLAEHRRHSDAGVRRLRQVVFEARDAHRQRLAAVPQIMTMVEMPRRRPAFVLQRGAYDAPGEAVEPSTPAVLPPFGARRRDRLGLAQWLVQPDHPLTARVAVNRFWHVLMGRGLVETVEDFGSQGARPTHPALLDWLARRFVDSGWDVKALVRDIVRSSTYRQASGGGAPSATRWWIGAAEHRWPAEMLRDAALAAAGLLVERVGGPPVKPYQPDGLWREKSGARYVPDDGEGLYRRSLYTYFKRTSPPPSMILFDAARRLTCQVRRPVTTTPLQALVLWNDPQWVEAARCTAEAAFAGVPESGPAGDRARLAAVFEALLGRAPNLAEQPVLAAMLAEQRQAFAAEPASAEAWVAVGSRPVAAVASAVEIAALGIVVSGLHCHDGFLRRR